MKKLLILIGLIGFLFSCECKEEPIVCGDCYRISIIIDSLGNRTMSEPWGKFTTCGDTLKYLNGSSYLVHIDETNVDIIDVTYCKEIIK